MARLCQALLHCLKNIGIWCQTGSSGLLSELLFQTRSDFNSDEHKWRFLGYVSWPGTFDNTVAGLAHMMQRRLWSDILRTFA